MKQLKKISGSVLVEFCIVGLVFFATIGAFIHFGFYLYTKEILVEGLSQTLRRAAVKSDETYVYSSAIVTERLTSDALNYFKSSYGVADGIIQIDQSEEKTGVCTKMIQGPTQQLTRSYNFRISASWKIPCTFVCIFTGRDSYVTAESNVVVEHPCLLNGLDNNVAITLKECNPS